MRLDGCVLSPRWHSHKRIFIDSRPFYIHTPALFSRLPSTLRAGGHPPATMTFAASFRTFTPRATCAGLRTPREPNQTKPNQKEKNSSQITASHPASPHLRGLVAIALPHARRLSGLNSRYAFVVPPSCRASYTSTYPRVNPQHPSAKIARREARDYAEPADSYCSWFGSRLQNQEPSVREEHTHTRMCCGPTNHFSRRHFSAHALPPST